MVHTVGAEGRFEHSFLEKDPGHFQVGVGESAVRIGSGHNSLGHIFGPLYPPDDGVQMLFGPKPNTSGSECTGVAIPSVVERLVDQLVDMGRPAGQIADHCGEVQ